MLAGQNIYQKKRSSGRNIEKQKENKNKKTKDRNMKSFCCKNAMSRQLEQNLVLLCVPVLRFCAFDLILCQKGCYSNVHLFIDISTHCFQESS